MPAWDSPDLLARCKRRLNRPDPDAAMTDPDWYAFLTEAQAHWFEVIAVHAPWALYGAPVQLTTSDGGQTYTFPTDPFPGGRLEIRAARRGELLTPGAEWDPGADYTWEGDKIRIPDGQTRSFPDGGPYARYIAAPGVIDAENEPALKPAQARRLLYLDACAMAAERLGTHDPEIFRNEARRAAWGEGGESGIIPALKTQLYGQGMEALDHAGGGAWWRYIDHGYRTI